MPDRLPTVSPTVSFCPGATVESDRRHRRPSPLGATVTHQHCRHRLPTIAAHHRKDHFVKTYRRHNCQAKHRTYATTAKCMFRRAAWIDGTGPIALLAWCDVLTVTLHQDLESAEKSRSFIDDLACGHACTRRHEIVRLELPTR